MKKSTDNVALLKGTLDLLIMKALSQDDMHGYGIAHWLEENSSGTLVAEDSAVYQALHRMESRRLIDADWATTENNRRARYYRLTDHGRQTLRTAAATWERYTESVSRILAVQRPPH